MELKLTRINCNLSYRVALPSSHLATKDALVVARLFFSGQVNKDKGQEKRVAVLCTPNSTNKYTAAAGASSHPD